jgi:hypothetical protein
VEREKTVVAGEVKAVSSNISSGRIRSDIITKDLSKNINLNYHAIY